MEEVVVGRAGGSRGWSFTGMAWKRSIKAGTMRCTMALWRETRIPGLETSVLTTPSLADPPLPRALSKFYFHRRTDVTSLSRGSDACIDRQMSLPRAPPSPPSPLLLSLQSAVNCFQLNCLPFSRHPFAARHRLFAPFNVARFRDSPNFPPAGKESESAGEEGRGRERLESSSSSSRSLVVEGWTRESFQRRGGGLRVENCTANFCRIVRKNLRTKRETKSIRAIQCCDKNNIPLESIFLDSSCRPFKTNTFKV